MQFAMEILNVRLTYHAENLDICSHHRCNE